MSRKETEAAVLIERLSELDPVHLVNALAYTIWKLDSLETRVRQMGARIHEIENDLVEEEE